MSNLLMDVNLAPHLLAGGLGLRERVRFLGIVSREEVLRQLRAADLFVLPSRFELLPYALLEAMAAAVPILLLAKGEAKNLVQQAECGIVLAPENPKLLAEAVLKLYHNDSFRRRLGQNGREYAFEHYNRQYINKRFEELLCKLFQGELFNITEKYVHS